MNDPYVKHGLGRSGSKPTQADVARLANVSQSAVSRVFAGRGYVAPEVKTKIEAAGRSLNYVPDLVARSMATGQSDIVAVLTTAITHPFVPQLLEQLTLATQARGLDVLLLNAPQGTQIERLVPVAANAAALEAGEIRAVSEIGTPEIMNSRFDAILNFDIAA